MIGRNLISLESDTSSLVEEIDGLLTATERQSIVDAMTSYGTHQESRLPIYEAELRRLASELPNATPSASRIEREKPRPLTPASDAASILANHLLEPEPKTLENADSAELNTVAPLNFGDSNTPKLREDLRAEMLAAIESKRGDIADELGRYAVSEKRNELTCAAALRGLLSEEEQQRILDAYRKFRNLQNEAFAKASSSPFGPMVMHDDVADAGTALLRTLVGKVVTTKIVGIRKIDGPDPSTAG